MIRQAWLMMIAAGLCLGLLPGCQLSFLGRRNRDDISPREEKSVRIEEKPRNEPIGTTRDQRESSQPDDSPTSHADASPYHLIKHPQVRLERKKTPVIRPLWLPDLEWPEPIRDEPAPGILPPVQLDVPFELLPIPHTVQQALPSPEKQEPLVESLNLFLKSKPEEALTCLEAYDVETRELLQRILPPLSLMARKKMNELTAEEATAVQLQLQQLINILRSRTQLLIERMCFCRRINGFADIEPLPASHEFQPGIGSMAGELVQVYVELKNVASLRREHDYETRLSSVVKICDAQNQIVWSRNFGDRDRPLRSPTLRHDYYNKYRFYLPPIPPGKYQLIVDVADQTSRPFRVASKSLDFVVGSAPNGR